MADNVTFQTTTLATPPGATVVATDDVAGKHYQRVKLDVGGDGLTVPVTDGGGGTLPVSLYDSNGSGITNLTAVAVKAILVEGEGNSVMQDDADAVRSMLVNSAGAEIAPAKETGGNLAAAASALSVIDDWDESDRAKVNLIAGQAGVQGGAGASSATTQRVAIATDANAISAASLPLPTGAATSALQTQPGVDIGDVTVNNAAGGAAVNIQDGGNVITVDGTVGVTGVSTLSEQQTQTTALQLIDDTVYTDDTSTHATGTSKGNLIMAAAAPTDAAVNANDIGAVAMTTDRKLHVSVQDALPAGSANIGDVDVLTVPSPLSTAGGGTEATAHRVTIANDSTGVLSVDDNGASLSVDWNGTQPVTGSGTATGALRVELPTNGTGVVTAAQATAASLNATVTQGPAGTAWEVIGDVAHDVAAPANPVLIGAQMETMADSAPGTRSGTDGDATKFATADGALFVIPTGAQIFTLHATGVQTGVQIHAAPSSGLSCYITAISFSIGAATASSIKVLNNGGSDFWGPHYLEAVNGRGLHVTFPTPLKGTAATRIDVTTTGAATQTVDIQGFIAPG